MSRSNLFVTERECLLTIEDDGKGFDVSKLTGVDASGRGAGLFIMRERTSLLGGTGFVESAPGKGTKVSSRCPWKETWKTSARIR